MRVDVDLAIAEMAAHLHLGVKDTLWRCLTLFELPEAYADAVSGALEPLFEPIWDYILNDRDCEGAYVAHHQLKVSEDCQRLQGWIELATCKPKD